MPAPARPVRRTIAAATTAMAVLALAACGGGRARPRPRRRPTTRTTSSRPGTLRVGTLTDAPPNVFLKDGKFTGFDNDLLTAVAGEARPKVEFVGTEFSALLAQVKNRQVRRRLLLDHHHRGAQEDRRLHQRLRLRLLRPRRARPAPASVLRPARRQARRRRAGHRPGRLRHQREARTRCACPDYNAALNQLQGRAPPTPGSRPPRSARRPPGDSGGKVAVAAKQLEPGAASRTPWRRATTALRDGARQGPRRGHRRRHLGQAAGAVLPGPSRSPPTSSRAAAPRRPVTRPS